jgi:hypothetical protein
MEHGSDEYETVDVYLGKSKGKSIFKNRSKRR